MVMLESLDFSNTQTHSLPGGLNLFVYLTFVVIFYGMLEMNVFFAIKMLIIEILFYASGCRLQLTSYASTHDVADLIR